MSTDYTTILRAAAKLIRDRGLNPDWYASDLYDAYVLNDVPLTVVQALRKASPDIAVAAILRAVLFDKPHLHFGLKPDETLTVLETRTVADAELAHVFGHHHDDVTLIIRRAADNTTWAGSLHWPDTQWPDHDWWNSGSGRHSTAWPIDVLRHVDAAISAVDTAVTAGRTWEQPGLHHAIVAAASNAVTAAVLHDALPHSITAALTLPWERLQGGAAG